MALPAGWQRHAAGTSQQHLVSRTATSARAPLWSQFLPSPGTSAAYAGCSASNEGFMEFLSSAFAAKAFANNALIWLAYRCEGFDRPNARSNCSRHVCERYAREPDSKFFNLILRDHEIVDF